MNDFLLHAPGELSPSLTTHLSHRFDPKLWISSLLLFGGVGMLSYGTNALIKQVSETSIKINADFDAEHMKLREVILLDVNTDRLYQNGILAITGLLSTVLSAGILLGMACRR